VRIFIWHGYLLSGTGSNEYTRALARTLAQQGHDVVVFCQDDGAGQDVGGARVVRPTLPGRLPVFVLDRYEGMEAALLTRMARAEVQEFVAANVAAIKSAGAADLLICNHVLLGGPVGQASGLPFVVKAHGSELEYAMRGNEQLCRWASESLRGAGAVIAGSEHIESVVADLVDVDPALVHVIPPGVDTRVMKPQPPGEALDQLLAEAERDLPNPVDYHNERLPDQGNASRLAAFLEPVAAGAGLDQPLVVYVGKLSEEKGVSLLLESLADPRLDGVRAAIVGFGPARRDLEEQARALGVPALFTGPLQHRHLCHLWPLASASVVPSVFPEAFGMVAAEAAACGCPPLVARHSGLAEIAEGLEAHLRQGLRLVSFDSGDLDSLRGHLAAVINLPPQDRADFRDACRATAVDLWSWGSVARRITELAPTPS